MRTVVAALGAAGLATAGWLVNAPSATAAAACSGSVLVSADYVRLFGGSPVVGSIQLRRDSCHRYWGQIIMYEPMKADTFAIAYIMKYTNGRRSQPISCDAPGGNGRWSRVRRPAVRRRSRPSPPTSSWSRPAT